MQTTKIQYTLRRGLGADKSYDHEILFVEIVPDVDSPEDGIALFAEAKKVANRSATKAVTNSERAKQYAKSDYEGTNSRGQAIRQVKGVSEPYGKNRGAKKSYKNLDPEEMAGRRYAIKVPLPHEQREVLGFSPPAPEVLGMKETLKQAGFMYWHPDKGGDHFWHGHVLPDHLPDWAEKFIVDKENLGGKPTKQAVKKKEKPTDREVEAAVEDLDDLIPAEDTPDWMLDEEDESDGF